MSATATHRWYFDPISPFAYLQWPKVKALRREFDIAPVPILLAAVLDARGQKGPAEIPSKREFIYRHALWQAREAGVALRFPPRHPFNPLPALRLCVAAGASERAIDAVFAWIWSEGRAADSMEAILPLCNALQVDSALLGHDTVKAMLRGNTEQALREGVFGVPTLAIGDGPTPALFWGNDAHAFAEAVLRTPALLDDPEFERLERLPVGVSRLG